PVPVCHLQDDSGEHARLKLRFGHVSLGLGGVHFELPTWTLLTNPRRNRAVYKPSLLVMPTCPSRTAPQEIMILDCHALGLNLFSTRLEGASNTMYGTYVGLYSTLSKLYWSDVILNCVMMLLGDSLFKTLALAMLSASMFFSR
ncbi:hypothetical protein TCAP_07258, partial [Tolypocladium capitatum]